MLRVIPPDRVVLLSSPRGAGTPLMLAGYATALISIQLWPPLFAILQLHGVPSMASLDQAAAAEVGGGVKALALQTSRRSTRTPCHAGCGFSPHAGLHSLRRLVNFW